MPSVSELTREDEARFRSDAPAVTQNEQLWLEVQALSARVRELEAENGRLTEHNHELQHHGVGLLFDKAKLAAENGRLTAERRCTLAVAGYRPDDDRPLSSLVSEALAQKDNEAADVAAENAGLKGRLAAAEAQLAALREDVLRALPA